jgi:hypothetical protein
MGSSSNSASREAQRAEDERQAAIRASQSRINQVFDGSNRAADIADYVGATRDYLTRDLNKQKGETDRQLRFALARGGLVGGSTQVDQQTRLGEDYSRGLLEADKRARGAGAEIEAADQDTRARLIGLATQGLDATTGAQQAAAAMRSNLEAGKSTSMVGGMGDFFGGFGNFLRDAREADARRRANRDTGFSLYSTPYGGG